MLFDSDMTRCSQDFSRCLHHPTAFDISQLQMNSGHGSWQPSASWSWYFKGKVHGDSGGWTSLASHNNTTKVYSTLNPVQRSWNIIIRTSFKSLWFHRFLFASTCINIFFHFNFVSVSHNFNKVIQSPYVFSVQDKRSIYGNFRWILHCTNIPPKTPGWGQTAWRLFRGSSVALGLGLGSQMKQCMNSVNNMWSKATEF